MRAYLMPEPVGAESHVLLFDRPLDGARHMIDVPEDVLDPFEVTGDPTVRRFRLPASTMHDLGPSRAFDAEAALRGIVDEIPADHGSIGLLSGDEFLPDAREFDRALLEASGPRVALLLCADPRAAPRSARLSLEHYRALGADPVVLDVLERAQARAEALPDFDVLFIAGGSPAVLLSCLAGTQLWAEAVRRWERGAALAGSSSGAMALCRACLVPEPGARVPTRWGNGLGPLERIGLVVHARSRPWEWRRGAARGAPVPVVAMDESTGIVLRAGAPPRTAGPGFVWII